MATAAQGKILPFRMGTRQRRAKLGALAYGANQTVTQILNRVGYLARLVIQFRGTVTLSGAGALADLGPWNLISRLRVSTNIGAAMLVDLTGYGAFLAGRMQREGQDFSIGGLGTAGANADIYAAPVAMGANTWALSYILPLSTSQGREFEAGLINLQSPETTVTVEIQTGALTDAAALITGIVGNFHIYVEWYEVPQPQRFAQPPLSIVRILEEKIPVLAQNAETPYVVPRMGVLLNAQSYVQLNSVRSDGFDYMSVRFNKTDNPYVQERQLSRILDRQQTLLAPITGHVGHDLYFADQRIGTGDGRDAVDTEELATIEFNYYVSGALGAAGTNFVNIVRRIAQRLDRAA